MAAAAATAAKRQCPKAEHRLKEQPRQRRERPRDRAVAAEAQSWRSGGRDGSGAAEVGSRGSALGPLRAPVCGDAAATCGASAPHTHHWELRNGGHGGGGGGEPGGAGPPQPVTTAGIFRTGLKTVDSRPSGGRGGSRATGLGACASPQPIGLCGARWSMRTETRGGNTAREELPLLPKSKQNKGGSAHRRAQEARAPGAGGRWRARREGAQRPWRTDKSLRLSVPASRLLRPGSGVSAQAGGLRHSLAEPAPTPCAPGPSRVTSELRRPRPVRPLSVAADHRSPTPTRLSSRPGTELCRPAPLPAASRARPRAGPAPARSREVGPGRARRGATGRSGTAGVARQSVAGS